MKVTGKMLDASETHFLAERLSKRLLREISRMSKSNVLHGQWEPSRVAQPQVRPPKRLYTGLVPLSGPPETDVGFKTEGAIGVVLEGGLTVVLGKMVYNVRAGDWLIFPRGVPHWEYSLTPDSPYRMYWFYLRTQLQELGENSYSPQEGFVLKAYKPSQKPSLESRKAMESILAEPDQPIHLLRLRVLHLVVWWLELLNDATQKITISGHPFVEKVRDLLEGSDVRSLSVELVARKMGLSRGHLSRSYRGLTGQTIRQAIQKTRLERAAQYLTDSSLSIKEIAYLVGFSKPQHLSRAFHDLMGMPPRTFRLRKAK